MADVDAFVLFGATGDLASKKLLPALASLACRDDLSIPVIGVARQDWSLERFNDRVRESVQAHGGSEERRGLDKLLASTRYVSGDYRDAATFTALKKALGGAQHPAHYLAIPPDLFSTVVGSLFDSDCAGGARVIVEKPFGRDEASACKLNAALGRVFPNDAIFRIDHYLGKEAVQNLLYFRFANTFLEPIWNRHYVERIEVTMAESFGVAGRGEFYEGVGAIRDVVQNHLLQVVALLTMEAPNRHTVDAVRNEKSMIFDAIMPLDTVSIACGQYDGYRREQGVDPESTVETFAALRLCIDNWRWAGVPVYVRAGKRMPTTVTEVTVTFRLPPRNVFGEDNPPGNNQWRFRLTPDVRISLVSQAKQPGDGMLGEALELAISRTAIASATNPYQRLLKEALAGDQTLFAREDGIEAAWAIVDPVLATGYAVESYAPGSWGPRSADAIGPPAGWHNPAADAPAQSTAVK